MALECLCTKLQEYVPLTIPTNSADELADRIANTMKECCVEFAQYIQSSDPNQLVIIAPDPKCKTPKNLVATFTTVVEGEWTVVDCVIRLDNIDIDVEGSAIIKQINVECCEPEPCCKPEKSCCKSGKPCCKPKSCCSPSKCDGGSCKKKCCSFYKEYKYCGKYIPTESEEEEFDSCCDNTGLSCRPTCEYPDICFNQPKINLRYGGYSPCDYVCEEETSPVMRLKKLPFKLPFKVRKHKGCIWYLIKIENAKSLDAKIRAKLQSSDGGYYRLRASEIEEYSGVSSSDPMFKYLNVDGMMYHIDEGDSSLFYLKLESGQTTRFKDISNVVTVKPTYTSYKGFLNDLFKCTT